MKNRKETKILLTFDYELSLGKDTGTVNKSIIEPTEIILDMIKKYNAGGLFFIDAAYLLTLKKFNHNDLKKIKRQLNRIIKLDNDIGLHLHPQWIDAELSKNEKWTFKSFEKYKLHSLSKKTAADLFKEGLNILYDLFDKEFKNYKITAYRAGGWCIQPFSFLKEIFIENDIIYDFSVTPGIKLDTSEFSNYDYTDAPKGLSSWKFENDPCVIDQRGRFTEIPLSTVKVAQLDLWMNYYLYKKNEKEYGDGSAISVKNSKIMKSNSQKKINKVFKVFKPVYAALNIDGLSNRYFIKFLKRFQNYNPDFITAVCHPKKISENSLKNLEYLLKNFESIKSLDL